LLNTTIIVMTNYQSENIYMKNSMEFVGELLERATDSEYLEKRMEMNKKSQLYDFAQWSIEQINPKEGDRALEVGCGRGTQAIPLSSIIGNEGELTLIDLSEESVKHVIHFVQEKTKTRGIQGSMDNIAILLGPALETYNVIYSVYALYYAKNPTNVLNEMFNRLIVGGSLCIIGPDGPHGLVELARKFHSIPPQVDNCFQFRSKVLEPFFKKNFPKFKISFLKNPQTITTSSQFIDFYRQTTYHNKNAEYKLQLYVEQQLNEHGEIKFDKYSYALVAEK